MRTGRRRPVRARVRVRASRALRRPDRVLERVAARHRDVALPDRRGPRRRRRRRASLGSNRPVGYDHDGAVANESAVVHMPDDHLCRAPDGRVVGSTVGPAGEAAIEAWVRRLAEPPSTPVTSSRRSRPSCRGWGCSWCEFGVIRAQRPARSPPALRERLRGLSDPRPAARPPSRCGPARSRTPIALLFRHLGHRPGRGATNPVEALHAGAAQARRRDPPAVARRHCTSPTPHPRRRPLDAEVGVVGESPRTARSDEPLRRLAPPRGAGGDRRIPASWHDSPRLPLSPRVRQRPARAPAWSLSGDRSPRERAYRSIAVRGAAPSPEDIVRGRSPAAPPRAGPSPPRRAA